MASGLDSSSGGPPEDPSSKKKPGKDFGGVIDELRHFLSDLGSEKPAEPTEESKISDNPLEVERPPLLTPSDVESEVLGDAAFNQASHTESVPPSDAEFWNGNVLGWSNAKEEDVAEEQKSFPSGATESVPVVPYSDPRPRQDIPPIEPPGVSKPNQFDWLKEPSKPSILPEPPPVPKIEPPDSPESEFIPMAPDIFSVGEKTARGKSSEPSEEKEMEVDISSLEALFPTPPLSPIEAAEKTEEGESPEVPMEEGLAESLNEKPPAPLKPKEMEVDEFIAQNGSSDSSEVPIPATISQKEKSLKDPKGGLDLHVTQMKPEGLIPVACIFPIGSEKLGQTFFSKLRDAGRKAKKSLDIQAVYIHGWANDQIDLVAWEKSASLFGADFMFIVVPKKDSELFLKLITKPSDSGIVKRLIYLEQINLRTLYAEILVHLNRKT